MKKYLFILLCIVLILSCTSSVKFLKPHGENISIKFIDGGKLKGELLALDDDMLFCESDGLLYKIKEENVSKIYVADYSLKNKKIITMLPPMLVCGMFAIIGFTGDDPEHKVILGIAALLPIPTFFFGDPKVDFSTPFEGDDLEKLKLYSRYPQGLTEEQWEQVLKYCDQDTFKTKLE